MHDDTPDTSTAIAFRPGRDLAFTVDDGPEVELYAGAVYMIPHGVTAAQAGELELAGEGRAIRRAAPPPPPTPTPGGGRTA